MHIPEQSSEAGILRHVRAMPSNQASTVMHDLIKQVCPSDDDNDCYYHCYCYCQCWLANQVLLKLPKKCAFRPLGRLAIYTRIFIYVCVYIYIYMCVCVCTSKHLPGSKPPESASGESSSDWGPTTLCRKRPGRVLYRYLIVIIGSSM